MFQGIRHSAAIDLPGRFAVADAFTSDTYNALCTEAEEYLSRGLLEQARELLLKAASLIGTRPRARSLLADACMALGLWSEAREQLEVLTTLEIQNVQNHYRLGQVLEELGEYELARDNYQVVADSDPSNRNASVAMGRLAGKASGAARPAQDELPRHTPSALGRSDVQIFPDVPAAEDVFATTEDIDNLLKDIGVSPGAGKDSDGEVSALLSKVGIDLEPKRKPEPVVEKPVYKDISEMLGTREAPQGGLEALFTPQPSKAPSTVPAPPVPETPDFSLESVFGAAPDVGKALAKPGIAEKPAVGAVEAPSAAVESLDVLFDVREAQPSELPVRQAVLPGPIAASASSDRAEPAPSSAISLDAIFLPEEKADAPAAPASEPPPAAEPAPPSVQAVLEYASLMSASPAQDPAPAEAVPAIESVLEAFFQTEQGIPAIPESPDANVSAEPAAGILETIFPADVEPPAASPAPAAQVPVEQVPAAPAAVVLESVFGMDEPSPAEIIGIPAELPVQPVEPPVQPVELPVQQAEPPVQQAEPGAAPMPEPPPPEAPAAAEYNVHKPGPDELLTVQLMSGELEIRLAYVVALDSGLSVREEGSRRLLGGCGILLLGQGTRTPVVVSLTPGCRVRSDRIAAFDSAISLEDGGIESLPGLSRVEGGSGSAVLFATGRFREARVAETGMRVRAGCLLFVEGGVSVAQDPAVPDFLLLGGNGRAVLAL
jgi:hypothetical protein